MECNKSHIRYMISLLVFQFMHPLWDATLCQKKWSQSFWISIHASLMGCNRSITAVMLRTTDFNSCIPYGMQPVDDNSRTIVTDFNSCIPYGMQLTHTFIYAKTLTFQFMHPLWDATAKYSIHIPIYTIFCIYCVILSSFISFTQSYLSIHLPLLVRISQCFYVRLRFAPASYSSLVQKT